jgi:hypothetical protein
MLDYYQGGGNNCCNLNGDVYNGGLLLLGILGLFLTLFLLKE